MHDYQDQAITALLCEQVYRRDTLDADITDEDIGKILSVSTPGSTSGFHETLTQTGKYEIDPQGYIYAIDTPDGSGVDNGFVARVVKTGDTYYITFRGSDLSNDFIDLSFDNAAVAVVSGGADSIAKKSEVDESAFQSSNPNLDYADWYWNGAQGVGTIDRNAQIFSALEVAQAVRDAVQADGGNDSQIVVTGQSLGGGLAGVVGAVTGLETITYAAAPFKNQIAEIARLDAAQYIIDTSDSTIFTSAFNALDDHQKKVVLYHLYENTIPTDAYLSSFCDTNQANPFIQQGLVFDSISPPDAGLLAQIYIDKFNLFNSEYNSNSESNQTSLRVKGEVLSNDALGAVFDIAGQYIKEDDDEYNFGPKPGLVGDFKAVSVGLHSPTLHAIAALTNESSDRNFAYLYESDEAFWDSMLVNTGIAGAQDYGRADIDGVSSKLSETGPNVGILQRALMKTISVDASGKTITKDGNFYEYFYQVFGEKLRQGIAADGLKKATGDANGSKELSLHAGLVEIGLQILRDGVQDFNGVDEFKEKIAGRLGITDDNKKHYFAGDFDDAVIFNLSAIDTGRKGEHSEKFVETLSNGDVRAFGISDIEFELV
ncbi:MAG: hypothetical protein AAGA50_24240, partial [Pseudomonadota bacterium]